MFDFFFSGIFTMVRPQSLRCRLTSLVRKGRSAVVGLCLCLTLRGMLVMVTATRGLLRKYKVYGVVVLVERSTGPDNTQCAKLLLFMKTTNHFGYCRFFFAGLHLFGYTARGKTVGYARQKGVSKGCIAMSKPNPGTNSRNQG